MTGLATYIPIMFVACGGALGSVARLGTFLYSQSAFGARFPFGTLIVNCLGSFLIGLLMTYFMQSYSGNAVHWRFFIVVGFLGAYTTFSAFAWDTYILFAQGQEMLALLNVLANNLGSILLVVLGIYTARWLGLQ